jgi:transposase
LEVVSHCRKGHTAVDVLEFFKRIDASVPRALSIHVVLDNLSAHKAPEITKWLAHPRRKRWHLHFTPTFSSWVNLIERWFKELFDRRLRRGVFTSVPDLIAAIELLTGTWTPSPSYGTNPRPRSSRRCAVAVPPSTRSNQRRTTRRPH